jgi:hypothetical protein
MSNQPSNQPYDQPQGQPYGQPPPAGYQQQPPYNPYGVYKPLPPYNTYAILALVLAVIVLPPLGIYFGNVAKKQIAQTGERGIELANAAVIVGWVMTVLLGAFFILWCLLFGSMMFGFFHYWGATHSSLPR